MKPCLVVYYSRTGMTQRLAARIAATYHCDLEPVREARSRKGVAGFVRSAYEAITGKQPEILPPTADPSEYDVVVLGTPVWAGRVASPMRSYIHRNNGRFNRVATFCTMRGSGGDKVLDEVAVLCGKQPIARLVVSDDEIEHERYVDKIGTFAQRALPS